MTAFTSATTMEAPNVSLRDATAAGLVTAFQKLPSPLLGRLPDDRGERDQDDEAQVPDHEAASEGSTPGRGSANW